MQADTGRASARPIDSRAVSGRLQQAGSRVDRDAEFADMRAAYQAQGGFARGDDLRRPDSFVGRIAHQQPAVTVEHGDALTAGQLTQMRSGLARRLRAEPIPQRARRQGRDVQRFVDGALGGGGHDAAGAHDERRGGEANRRQHRHHGHHQRAGHLTSLERPLGRSHRPVGAGFEPLADQCDA